MKNRSVRAITSTESISEDEVLFTHKICNETITVVKEMDGNNNNKGCIQFDVKRNFQENGVNNKVNNDNNVDASTEVIYDSVNNYIDQNTKDNCDSDTKLFSNHNNEITCFKYFNDNNIQKKYKNKKQFIDQDVHNVESEIKLDKVTKQRPTNYNPPKVNNQIDSNVVKSDIHNQNELESTNVVNTECINGKYIIPVVHNTSKYSPCVENITDKDNNNENSKVDSIEGNITKEMSK